MRVESVVAGTGEGRRAPGPSRAERGESGSARRPPGDIVRLGGFMPRGNVLAQALTRCQGSTGEIVVNETALVLGASGQVGAAVMAALQRDGWLVRADARSRHRWPEGVTGVVVNREDDVSLAGAIGSGVDLLVDCVAYDKVHARQITALAGSVGSAVVLSSVSVYADERGRTLDEATGPDDFPVLPVPVGEDQATVPPGPATYSTRKAAMEQVLLNAEAGLPVTVLRPGAISGPGSVHPRELWFAKRALDRRPVQILAYQGRSQFHTTSTPNLAELVRLAAAHPGPRVLNAVDPQAPTTAQIGAAVNAVLGHHPRESCLRGHPTRPSDRLPGQFRGRS